MAHLARLSAVPRCTLCWGGVVHGSLIKGTVVRARRRWLTPKPRKESSLRAWIAQNWPEGDAKALIKEGHVVRVETEPGITERLYRLTTDTLPYCLNAGVPAAQDEPEDALALSQSLLAAAVAADGAPAETVRLAVKLQRASLVWSSDASRCAFWLNVCGALHASASAKFGVDALADLHVCGAVSFLVASHYVSLNDVRYGILRANRALPLDDEGMFDGDDPKAALCCADAHVLAFVAACHPGEWIADGAWDAELSASRLLAVARRCVERHAEPVRSFWPDVAPLAAELGLAPDFQPSGTATIVGTVLLEGGRADPLGLGPDTPEGSRDAFISSLLARAAPYHPGGHINVEAMAHVQQCVQDTLASLRTALDTGSNKRPPAKAHGAGAGDSTALPRLLTAGGQGVRLWKAPHEVLVVEISSRIPPLAGDLVAAPQVRGDSERFQAALRATVGALDVSEKAGRVMQELLNSEREYFTDLGMLQRLYVKPLTEGVKTKGYFVTERDVGDLFSNFDDIFRLNLELLRQLEVESKKPQSSMDAGQLFLNFADRFQVYAVYCSNANAAKKRMEALASTNKRFAEFCEKARSHSAHKGLDIGSFLIKPLQRLCQYPLLLRELLQALPDQDNELYAKLQTAHKVMSETVETVNGMLKSIRKRTELSRLSQLLTTEQVRCDLLKPGRQFSAVASFRVRMAIAGRNASSKWHQWDCWLMSDLLALTEPTKQSDRVVLKAWLPLEKCEVLVDGATVAQGASDAALETGRRTMRTMRGEPKQSEPGLVIAVSDGTRIFMVCDDKNQLNTWVKKLNKKLKQSAAKN